MHQIWESCFGLFHICAGNYMSSWYHEYLVILTKRKRARRSWGPPALPLADGGFQGADGVFDLLFVVGLMDKGRGNDQQPVVLDCVQGVIAQEKVACARQDPRFRDGEIFGNSNGYLMNQWVAR